jgi:ATP-binding cassette subfamily C protein CydD
MILDPRLLRLARDSRAALVLTVFFGLLSGLAIVFQARLMALVIARVFLGGADLVAMALPLKLLLIAIFARALLALGGEVTSSQAATRIKSGLRMALLARIQALGPVYKRGERSGELVSALSEGVEALQAYFSQYLPGLALAALVPLAVLLAVFPLDWISGIVLLFTAPLIPLFMVLIGDTASRRTQKQWAALGRLSAHFLDALQGLATLKAFGRSREHTVSVAQAGEAYRRATLGVLRITFLSALVLELVATLSTAVVAVQVGLRLLYGRLAFEEALFVLILAPEFYLPLRALGARFHAGTAGVSAAKRIFAVLETPVEISRVAEVTHPANGKGGIFPLRFERVSYTYPPSRDESESRPPALDGVTFTLEEGEHVACVGPSGGGKTTLTWLLLRFIDPSGGEILANGSPLRDLPPEEWRRQVTWVPQAPHLFNGTLLENLRIGNPTATHEQIEGVLRQARLERFVSTLTDGLEMRLGEGGARLSGGQAQRLALARALLKPAQLLLLDEPTSNLDPEEESLLQDAWEAAARGRTLLTVAHRLATASRAGRILVLDGGRLVESGNPAALAAQGGAYAALLNAGGGAL